MSNLLHGLGDVVAKTTSAFGIKPCEICLKRQAWLNQKFPFRISSIHLGQELKKEP